MDFPRIPGEIEPDYIGDGVYVSFDGYNIWLRTSRESVWHEVSLNPDAYAALLRYRERVLAKAKENQPCP